MPANQSGIHKQHLVLTLIRWMPTNLLQIAKEIGFVLVVVVVVAAPTYVTLCVVLYSICPFLLCRPFYSNHISAQKRKRAYLSLFNSNFLFPFYRTISDAVWTKMFLFYNLCTFLAAAVFDSNLLGHKFNLKMSSSIKSFPQISPLSLQWFRRYLLVFSSESKLLWSGFWLLSSFIST